MAVYTIGNSSTTGASVLGISTDGLYLTKRTLSGAAAGSTWTALRAFIENSGSGSARKIRLAIYDDLSGSPNNLLGGGEITVPGSTGPIEYTVTLPGTASAANGDYWVGAHIEVGSNPRPYYVSTGGVMAYGFPPYASGLPSPYNEDATNSAFDLRVAADATSPTGGGSVFVPQIIIVG